MVDIMVRKTYLEALMMCAYTLTIEIALDICAQPSHVSEKCRTFADSKSKEARDRTECKDIKH
jgi:hypothetical protein